MKIHIINGYLETDLPLGRNILSEKLDAIAKKKVYMDNSQEAQDRLNSIIRDFKIKLKSFKPETVDIESLIRNAKVEIEKIALKKKEFILNLKREVEASIEDIQTNKKAILGDINRSVKDMVEESVRLEVGKKESDLIDRAKKEINDFVGSALKDEVKNIINSAIEEIRKNVEVETEKGMKTESKREVFIDGKEHQGKDGYKYIESLKASGDKDKVI